MAGEGDGIRALLASPALMEVRQLAARLFSWAVPSEEALSVIIDQSGGRIVEVGSGSGYWAKLLKARGADVVAVDDGVEYGVEGATWFPSTVIEEGSAYLRQNGGCGDRALFLCWPRAADGIVDAYTGDTLVVIGEPEGCSTWCLDEDDPSSTACASCLLPTWPCMHDRLVVYKRLTN